MGNARFRKHPRPDDEVIEVLEFILQSARHGYVRSIAVIAANPVNQIEIAFAGDLSQPRRTAVLGGIMTAAIEIAQRR